MTDRQIAEKFKISETMLQRWKNAHDYRYLVYSFISKGTPDLLKELFFETIEKVEGVRYLGAEAFVESAAKRMDDYAQGFEPASWEEYFTADAPSEMHLVGLDKEHRRVRLFLFPVRFPSQKKLDELLASLHGALKEGLTLESAAFITTDHYPKKLTRYSENEEIYGDHGYFNFERVAEGKEENGIAQCAVDRLHFDLFTKYAFGGKVIIVPS